MNADNKPFYLQPPWDILFNVHKLQRINPWSVKIAFLLLSFLEEMERRANIDFRASGVALDSSASIYLLKSNLLLKLEEPPTAQPKPSVDFVPPPLILPLRYELTTTTIESLIEALDEALRSESLLTLKAPQKPILPPPEIVPTISAYLMEIEDEIERLTRKMRLLVDRGDIITFSKLVEGLGRIEMVRVFVILLFMAQRGKITLWQHEEFGEIYVTLNGEVSGADISG
ncbi:MAG: hypothetical protein QW804_01135 [Candidatus Bathyarchaeia archaeon]|nr:hypothetical protein [Candidatus Bathyarchaeota archaeon]